MKRFRSLLAAAAVSLGLVGCQQSAVEPAAGTADEVAVQMPSISTSSSALSTAGLRKRLRNPEPITYLAPSEEAWRALPAMTKTKSSMTTHDFFVATIALWWSHRSVERKGRPRLIRE